MTGRNKPDLDNDGFLEFDRFLLVRSMSTCVDLSIYNDMFNGSVCVCWSIDCRGTIINKSSISTSLSVSLQSLIQIRHNLCRISYEVSSFDSSPNRASESSSVLAIHCQNPYRQSDILFLIPILILVHFELPTEGVLRISFLKFFLYYYMK